MAEITDQNNEKEQKYNVENLVSLADRTEEEKKRIASLGGKASGQKKRLARDMRESMKVLLDMTVTTNKQREVLGEDAELLSEYTVTLADLMNLKMIQEALQGNTKAFDTSRDTGGYKPIEQVQTDINIMTESDKALLEKVARRNGINTERD